MSIRQVHRQQRNQYLWLRKLGLNDDEEMLSLNRLT
jgi:hypothetical protein